MSTQLNQNTIDLQSILDTVNALPEAGSGATNYYTGSSIPDDSFGKDGELFFVV